MDDSDEGSTPRYSNAGPPLIGVYPGTPSGCLAEAIFSEDVGSVQTLVQEYPQLTQQNIEHWGPLYSQWVKRCAESNSLENGPVDMWEPGRKTEPALILACLVPLYKHPYREDRAISKESLDIVKLLVKRGATLPSPKVEGVEKHSWAERALFEVCRHYDNPEVFESAPALTLVPTLDLTS